jgi:predicted extracellular nuclease
MRRSLRLFATLGLILSVGFGCRSESGNGDNPDAGGPGPDGGDEGVTIYDIQTPGGSHSAIGTPVELYGVVVTAVDRFGNLAGSVYVQEPAGGAYSGLVVFRPTISGGTLDDIQPGDLVDVTGGIVDEFALDTDTSGNTLTEIAAPMDGMVTVTKVGTATVPAPEDVDATALGDPDTGGSESEKWEGVLIRLTNVAATSSPRGVSATDPTLAEMDITGPFRVSSSLTALLTAPPDNMPLYMRDQCFDSITGIGDYFFTYKLLPRDSADIITAADNTNCLYEETAVECGDGTDDDFDGFTDCADFSCQQANPELCTSDTSIPDIQMGIIPDGSLVRVEGVVVTAVASSLVWVQDPAGGEYSGVAVFPTGGPPAGLDRGDIVTVEGTVDEYFDVTEIAFATITETGVAPVPMPEMIADPSTLVVEATAEPWEGVLIEIAGVDVSAAPDEFGEWTVGAFGLHIDDIMYAPAVAPAPGDCAVRVAGPFHFSFSNYKIEPRDVGDVTITPGVSCP